MLILCMRTHIYFSFKYKNLGFGFKKICFYCYKKFKDECASTRCCPTRQKYLNLFFFLIATQIKIGCKNATVGKNGLILPRSENKRMTSLRMLYIYIYLCVHVYCTCIYVS